MNAFEIRGILRYQKNKKKLIYTICNKNTAALGITFLKTQHKVDKLLQHLTTTLILFFNSITDVRNIFIKCLPQVHLVFQ